MRPGFAFSLLRPAQTLAAMYIEIAKLQHTSSILTRDLLSRICLAENLASRRPSTQPLSANRTEWI